MRMTWDGDDVSTLNDLWTRSSAVSNGIGLCRMYRRDGRRCNRGWAICV